MYHNYRDDVAKGKFEIFFLVYMDLKDSPHQECWKCFSLKASLPASESFSMLIINIGHFGNDAVSRRQNMQRQ